jgi:hypothetical protein
MRTLHHSWIIAAALAAISCGGNGNGGSASTADPLAAQGVHEPPMLGIHWARGQGGPAATSPLMTWHSGAILNSAAVTAIFWGTSWASPTFTGDKVTGLDSFYSGVGGSHYAGTNTEYTGTNGTVGTGVAYGGHVVDASAAPTHAPKTSQVLAEVCSTIANPVVNGFYPVYVDAPRGHARYCAWHSYGSCNGVPVQFGFFFSLDGDPGCDPQDTSGLHSQGLAALANVSGHEISETFTDPRNGGWYDSSGAENADKCAWTFGAPLLTFSNGTEWKVQGNWSNAAFTAGTGYPNSSGQNGCLSGL